jgi:hypothetical protein
MYMNQNELSLKHRIWPIGPVCRAEQARMLESPLVNPSHTLRHLMRSRTISVACVLLNRYLELAW